MRKTPIRTGRFRRRSGLRALLIGISVFGPLVADAQVMSVGREVVLLNRAGRWGEAAELATRRLASPNVSPVQRCGLLVSASWALMGLQRMKEATEALDAFDLECGEVPIEEGFRKDAKKISPFLPSARRPAARGVGVLDLATLTPSGGLSRRAGTSTPPKALQSNADGFWRRMEPPAAITDFLLKAHDDLCAQTGADACLVVRRGRIASEWYRTGAPDSLAAMSSTKSVAGLLAMTLLADGKLRSLDAPVCGYVAEWCDATRRSVTVRHLLTMTSGLAPRTSHPAVGTAGDMNAFVSQLRPAAAPGTRWWYSNEGAQLLAPVMDRAAGEPVQRYAGRRLFGPLGMRDTRFYVDARGHAATYANLLTTPRDLARVGLLMTQRGTWAGRRVLPAALIDSLVSRSQPLHPNYGMLWWRLSVQGSEAYVTRGHLATNMYVFPDRDLVVVRMQNQPSPGDRHVEYEPAALPLFRALLREFGPAHWH